MTAEVHMFSSSRKTFAFDLDLYTNVFVPCPILGCVRQVQQTIIEVKLTLTFLQNFLIKPTLFSAWVHLEVSGWKPCYSPVKLDDFEL